MSAIEDEIVTRYTNRHGQITCVIAQRGDVCVFTNGSELLATTRFKRDTKIMSFMKDPAASVFALLDQPAVRSIPISLESLVQQLDTVNPVTEDEFNTCCPQCNGSARSGRSCRGCDVSGSVECGRCGQDTECEECGGDGVEEAVDCAYCDSKGEIKRGRRQALVAFTPEKLEVALCSTYRDRDDPWRPFPKRCGTADHASVPVKGPWWSWSLVYTAAKTLRAIEISDEASLEWIADEILRVRCGESSVTVMGVEV